MVDTTILEKLDIIFNFIKKNSLIGLIILLLIFILLDLLYGNNKKETKIMYIVITCLSIIGILLTYYKPFLNLINIFVSYIFKITYFPSIIEYIIILIFTIFLQFYKSKNKYIKTINLWVGVIIEALFIFNLIALNKITIDLKTITSIYENNLLLSLFQITSFIFMINIIINLIAIFISLFLNDEVEIPKLVDDDIDEEYE